MDHNELPAAEGYSLKRQRRKRWHRVVTCLAAIVVFCTTYALILPAITLENSCDIPEHTHTESCYAVVTPQVDDTAEPDEADAAAPEPERILICTQAEHTHSAACRTQAADAAAISDTAPEPDTAPEQEPEPLCGITAHVHTAECRSADGTLLCGMEEHIHVDACCLPPEIPADGDAANGETPQEDASDADNADADAAEPDEPADADGESDTADTADADAITDEAAIDTSAVAEAAIGDNWKYLRDSGWFEAYSDCDYGDYGISLTAAAPGDTSPSSVQVDSPGGTNEADDVTVSKTIAGTDIENVFDITLTVQTPQKIEDVINEPDMAVVIVMDISNTMKSDFGDSTRYKAAMEAAEDFLDKFVASNSLGVSKVGYVAFNTDAHQIFGLSPCTNAEQANVLKNTMRTETGNIINKDGYASAHNRFTNIEGGLKMARDMLNGVSNKNKFVIFLSDGFPTTYVKDGYSGHDPIYSNINSDQHNYIRDDIYPNKAFPYGTNYSDRGAVKAQEMATALKNSKVKIFSIGVDVAGQKLQDYITQSATKEFSTMDRTSETYVIGGVETGHFETWLENSIGSGYYYNSTNTAGLKDAYNQIFEQIKTTVAESTEADWVASDPIPSITPDEIDFIGLYDKGGTLKGDSLTGAHAVEAENTAEYKAVEDAQNKAIEWDLKNSGYTETGQGGSTIYTYTLKYRIRLRNEDGQFVEGKVYDTNGETKLQYRVVQTVNGTTTLSDSKTINFPIPSVHGYLGELTFTKKDSYDRPVAGAEFTLHHADTCNSCRGDKTRVEIDDQTATSGADGTVKFESIPSGHTYTLTETKIPDGYYSDGSTYTVLVAYDVVKVTVTKADGSTETWDGSGGQSGTGGETDSESGAAPPGDGTITNGTSYELPKTGGSGTTLYTAGGLLLMAAAAALYGRRRRKEDSGHS